MSKENFCLNYRDFIVYPYKNLGVVFRSSGNAKEFLDSNGYRIIKDKKGKKHLISHIIYASGCAFPNKFPKSYKFMKNVIISYKDKNKLNCNFINLKCKLKKKYIKKTNFEKQIAMCFK